MLNLLNTLETVFQKYIPWHSEQEVKDALSAVAELKKELQGDAPQAEQIVETAEKVVDPTPLAAVSSVTPAEDSTGTAAATTDPANTTVTTTPDAPVTTVDATVNTASVAPVHFTEPEPQPFPGSYTPPPAA